MTSSLSWRSSTDFEAAARWPWLSRLMLTVWRRGPVVVLALIIGLVAAIGISHVSGVKYQSTALIVVTGTPGTANGANSLAATYAGFHTEDEVMQQALAKAIGTTDPSEYPSIGNRLVATVLNNSAIIKLTFTAPSPQEAQSGLHALVSDLTVGALQWQSAATPHSDCSVNYVEASHKRGRRAPAWPRRPRCSTTAHYRVRYPLACSGYVVLVKDASTGTRSTPAFVKTGTLGAFGSATRFVVAVAWERSDRRVDDIDDVRARPTASVGRRPYASYRGVDPWPLATGRGVEQTQVGIVKVGRTTTTSSPNCSGPSIRQPATRPSSSATSTVGQSVLEGLDTKTPIVVLCVAQGTARAKLADVVRRLRELGHTPDWAFLVPSSTIANRLPTANKADASDDLKELNPSSRPARNGHASRSGPTTDL